MGLDRIESDESRGRPLAGGAALVPGADFSPTCADRRFSVTAAFRFLDDIPGGLLLASARRSDSRWLPSSPERERRGMVSVSREGRFPKEFDRRNSPFPDCICTAECG